MVQTTMSPPSAVASHPGETEPRWRTSTTRGSTMADPKFDKLAADIDDASTVVEELQVNRDDADAKLNDLRQTLEHAADVRSTATTRRRKNNRLEPGVPQAA